MANKERLQKVLDHLKNLDPKRFNYSKWVGTFDGWNLSDLTAVKDLIDNTCGTTGCIAGWTCAIFKNEINVLREGTIGETAQRLLDLTHDQAHFLFFAGELYYYDELLYPHWSCTEKYADDMDLEDLPIQEAIDRLEFAIQNF